MPIPRKWVGKPKFFVQQGDDIETELETSVREGVSQKGSILANSMR